MLFRMVFVVTAFWMCAPAHARQDPPLLRLNTVLTLDASRMSDFDQSWAVLQRWASANTFPFYTPHSQIGNTRLLTTIIAAHGDIDTIQSFIARAMADPDADVKQAVGTILSSVESHRSYVTRYDPALSYSPPGSYVGGYHEVTTCTYAADKKPAVEQVLKDIKSLWARSKQKSAFHISWLGLGARGSGVEIRRSAKTLEARKALDYQIARTLDAEDAAVLDAQLARLCDRIERMGWTSRLDLLIKISGP